MSEFDIKIIGGSVHVGDGTAAKSADVGIKDGKIAAIGKGLGAATETIDAKGALVMPGFVDIHGHYDGQVSWDDEIAPSAWHGVTTCVMGSCGVGFAPVRATDHDKLIALMEGVEDIPGSALAEGIRWGWETFPDYLDVLSKTPRAIDICTMVPHDALRMYVMGERAIHNVDATDEDIRLMRGELEKALAAGAFGFSTGRTDNHRGRDGSETPSADVISRELAGLGQAFKSVKHGVLQAVSDFDMPTSKDRFDPEFELLLDLARAADRPLSISVMQRTGDTEQWKRVLSRISEANTQGLRVKGQVAPRGIGVLLGLETTFQPFMGFPSYKEISQLPLAERVRELSNPARKAKLLTEKSERVAGDGSSVPPFADQLLQNIEFIAMNMFRLGARPNYEPDRKTSIYGEAMQKGVKVLELLYDILLEDDGKALIYFPVYNYAGGSLDDVAEMLHHPHTMLGLSDGGAHVGTICDASFPTFLLTHWARDRADRKFSVERAIAKLTSEPAAWMGLSDRGTLEVGKRADVNVIDLPALDLPRPKLYADLPAGGKRLLQTAEGILATLVAGQVTRRNGVTQPVRPGRIVRAGRM